MSPEQTARLVVEGHGMVERDVGDRGRAHKRRCARLLVEGVEASVVGDGEERALVVGSERRELAVDRCQQLLCSRGEVYRCEHQLLFVYDESIHGVVGVAVGHVEDQVVERCRECRLPCQGVENHKLARNERCAVACESIIGTLVIFACSYAVAVRHHLFLIYSRLGSVGRNGHDAKIVVWIPTEAAEVGIGIVEQLERGTVVVGIGVALHVGCCRDGVSRLRLQRHVAHCKLYALALVYVAVIGCCERLLVREHHLHGHGCERLLAIVFDHHLHRDAVLHGNGACGRGDGLYAGVDVGLALNGVRQRLSRCYACFARGVDSLNGVGVSVGSKGAPCVIGDCKAGHALLYDLRLGRVNRCGCAVDVIFGSR